MQLTKLITSAAEAMRSAAYESYYDYHRSSFRGCTASIRLPRCGGRRAYIVIECDAFGRHTVVAEGGRMGEYPLLEARLTDELNRRDVELDAFLEAENDDEEAWAESRNFYSDYLSTL